MSITSTPAPFACRRREASSGMSATRTPGKSSITGRRGSAMALSPTTKRRRSARRSLGAGSSGCSRSVSMRTGSCFIVSMTSCFSSCVSIFRRRTKVAATDARRSLCLYPAIREPGSTNSTMVLGRLRGETAFSVFAPRSGSRQAVESPLRPDRRGNDAGRALPGPAPSAHAPDMNNVLDVHLALCPGPLGNHRFGPGLVRASGRGNGSVGRGVGGTEPHWLPGAHER